MIMKKTFCFSILALAFVSTTLSQEVIYIEYKDGRSQKEEVANVSNISFHNADELPAEAIVGDISKGLVAYYTFDNETFNDLQNHYNGFSTGGKFITDTPCGTGKAIFLKRGEQVFIPFAPINGLKNHTISMWVKDFGSGPIYMSYDNHLFSPSLVVTENVKLKAYTGESNHNCTFSTDLSIFQTETWNMLTIVTKTDEDRSEGTCELYINGQLIQSQSSYTYDNLGATTMSIGGSINDIWADPMKVDNVRLYDIALTKDDIAAIYNREKKTSVITISPLSLYFDKNTDKMTLTITNTTLDLREYSITSTSDLLSLSSIYSYIPAKGSKIIEVSIKDRDLVNKFTKESITFEVEGMRYAIDVQVEKGNNSTATSETVSRGLQAYYKFDTGSVDDSCNDYDGIIEGGTYISDTPSEKGKALFLKKGEYATIPYAPFDGKRNHTISLWVKDFGSGAMFQTYDNHLFAPSLIVTEEMKLKAYTGETSHNRIFSANLSSYQSDKWTMITVVTETKEGNSEGICKLYINGQKADAGTSYTYDNSGAIAMSIGSSNTDPFKVDNIRLYSVALTDDEVMEIYNAERK